MLTMMKWKSASAKWVLFIAIFFEISCDKNAEKLSRDEERAQSSHVVPADSTNLLEIEDLPVSVSVVFCEPVSKDVDRDPFAKPSSATLTAVEKWSPITKELSIDRILGKELKDRIQKSTQNPSSSFPAVGYRDGAVILDEEGQPIYSILRLNMNGYYRFSPNVDFNPSGYAIDLMQSHNMTFFESDDFDDLLWSLKRGDAE